MANQNKAKSKGDYSAAVTKINELIKVGEKKLTETQADKSRTSVFAANVDEKASTKLPRRKPWKA